MKKMLTPLLALGLLAGCSTVAVNSETARDANLANFKTFGWYAAPGAQGKPESLADQDIRSSIEKNLAAKGITHAAEGNPDFFVAFHTKTQQEMNVADYGYGYWGGWGPDVYTYTQGTIVIDFIDPKSNKVFWHGTASGVVDHPENPNAEKIDSAVSKVMERYQTTPVAAQ